VKKMRFALNLLFAASALLAAPPARSPSTNAENEVLATERARTEALDHSDLGALNRIMADDITYVHASGEVDNKKSYLDAIRSGKLHYISWKPRNLQVRMMGNGAVINGEYLVRVTDSRVKPTPFDINIFVLSVYGRRDGRWQQIAWQSTRDVALSPLK
jgi:hypothetical protein